VTDEVDELDELGGPGGPDPREPVDGLLDMSGQFFEEGLVVELPDDLLEELLVDDELGLVEELAAALTAVAVVTAAESDADVFVVATFPVDPDGERAKAVAVPPPIRTPDTPSTAIECLSFGCMLNITSFLQVPPRFGGQVQSEAGSFAPPWSRITTSCERPPRVRIRSGSCLRSNGVFVQVRVVTSPCLSVTTQNAGVVHDTAVNT
jgi:hypothetical protein